MIIDGLINAPETVGGFMKKATGSDDAFGQVVATHADTHVTESE